MNLSIVIPVFNSSNILNILIKQIISNIDHEKIKKFEIILVNDSSRDNSWEIIAELVKKNINIKGINLSENFGQHSAIFAGLKYSSGDIIITMDDDLQHPPNYIMEIFNKLDEYDLCYTIYKKRKHLLWKRVISYINNIFSSFLFNKSISIYLSSFRGFRSDVKEQAIAYEKPIIFLDSLLLKHSKNICSINVLHEQRFEGDSNYNIKNLFSLWFDAIENYHFYPLRIGTLISLISIFIVKIIRFGKNKKKIQFKILEKTF